MVENCFKRCSPVFSQRSGIEGQYKWTLKVVWTSATPSQGIQNGNSGSIIAQKSLEMCKVCEVSLNHHPQSSCLTVTENINVLKGWVNKAQYWIFKWNKHTAAQLKKKKKSIDLWLVILSPHWQLNSWIVVWSQICSSNPGVLWIWSIFFSCILRA